jgi:hypothetical protein
MCMSIIILTKHLTWGYKLYFVIDLLQYLLKLIGLQWAHFPQVFQILIKMIEMCHLDIVAKYCLKKKVHKLTWYELLYSE